MANKRISELTKIDDLSYEDLFIVQNIYPFNETTVISWLDLLNKMSEDVTANTASYSVTSSFSDYIISSSWASNSLSSSYAESGSGSGIFAITSSYAEIAEYTKTASYASGSGVYALSSSYSETSSYSITSSTSTSSSFSLTASYASGSGVHALSSSYSETSSYSDSSSYAEYSPNGIETGFLILWAGLEDDTLTSSYLQCDGKDYSTVTYESLYGVIGRKFGYYPQLTLSASYVTNTDLDFIVKITGSSANIYSQDVYTGNIQVSSSNSGPLYGTYAITLVDGSRSVTQILNGSIYGVSFPNLNNKIYRINVTELNSGLTSTYVTPTSIGVSSKKTSGIIPISSDINLRGIKFTPSSNTTYHSKFLIQDLTNYVTETGSLSQSSAGDPNKSIVSATFYMSPGSPVTFSIIKYSGSYFGTDAFLPDSRNTFEVSYTSIDNIPGDGYFTISESFFVPNLNYVSGSGSIPWNISPSNEDIYNDGNGYTPFKYYIKT